jgi:hypothetical protein
VTCDDISDDDGDVSPPAEGSSEAEELWPDTVTCDDISDDDGDGSPPASFKLPLAHTAAKFDCVLSCVPTYAKNNISEFQNAHTQNMFTKQM